MSIQSTNHTIDELINRAYWQLKTEFSHQEKKVFVKPEIISHNRRTYITNFIKYCESIEREPETVKKFLEKDMGTSSSIVSENSLATEKSGLKFSTTFRQQVVMTSITNYMKIYVLCKICRSGCTEIIKKDKILFVCCRNCKADNAV